MAFITIPQEFASKTTDQIVSEAGTGGLPLIQPGKHVGLFLKSEMKPTKDNKGQYLEMKAILTQGQFRDTEFTVRLNLVNSNPTAVKIAYETLAKIAKAVGLQSIPTDTSVLHNKPMTFDIKTRPGTEYTDKTTGEVKKGRDFSEIDGFEPAPGIGAGAAGGAPATAAAAQGTAPAANLPWQK